jgi:hypothetical protein
MQKDNKKVERIFRRKGKRLIYRRTNTKTNNKHGDKDEGRTRRIRRRIH